MKLLLQSLEKLLIKVGLILKKKISVLETVKLNFRLPGYLVLKTLMLTKLKP